MTVSVGRLFILIHVDTTHHARRAIPPLQGSCSLTLLNGGTTARHGRVLQRDPDVEHALYGMFLPSAGLMPLAHPGFALASHTNDLGDRDEVGASREDPEGRHFLQATFHVPHMFVRQG